MADYIEREAALNFVLNTAGDYAAAYSEIRKYPAADVAPVKHGKWERDIGDIHSNGVIYYCTSCHKNTVLFKPHLMNTIKYSHPYIFELPAYCPNCGAKMEKGNENG